MNLTIALTEERTRLTNLITELTGKKADLDAEIAQYRVELKAIDAYDQAKNGTPRATKTKGARSTGRQAVLDLIKLKPSTRAELIEALGIKSDKAKQQSLSNTLTNLKKDKAVELVDGVYTAL